MTEHNKVDLALINPTLKNLQQVLTSKLMMWGMVFICGIILAISYVNVKGTSKRVKDFLAFEFIKKEIDTSSIEQIDRLNRYTRKYPELKAGVETLLARALMNKKDLNLATALVQKHLTQGSFVWSYYLEFSKISLLIEEKELQEALALSLDLQNNILKDQTFWEEKKANMLFGADLVLFNKLRIITLFKTLGYISEEANALSELKQMLTEGVVNGIVVIPKEIARRFEAAFLCGTSASVLDFIETRQKTLNR